MRKPGSNRSDAVLRSYLNTCRGEPCENRLCPNGRAPIKQVDHILPRTGLFSPIRNVKENLFGSCGCGGCLDFYKNRIGRPTPYQRLLLCVRMLGIGRIKKLLYKLRENRIGIKRAA